MKIRAMQAVISLFAASVLWMAVPVFATPPTYTVKKATGKIVVDGILDEGDWAAAPSTGTFKFMWAPNYWYTPIDSLSQQTEAKFLWDDNFLYLAFICHNKKIYSNYYTTNSATWYDSAAELFWNPTPGANASAADSLYYQFEFNAVGNLLSVFHYRMRYPSSTGLKPTPIITPHIGRNIAGTLNNSADVDSLWILEIAIRFTDYPDSCYVGNTGNGQGMKRAHVVPQAGDKWRAELSRCEGTSSASSKATLYSQWAPSSKTAPAFHSPADFGTLIFSTDPVRTVGVETHESSALPSLPEIRLNHPNPFNPSTTVDFVLPTADRTRIVIYDINGRKVCTLLDQPMTAGAHTALWNGRDDRGTTVSSGAYIVRLRSGNRETSRKVLLMK